MGKIIYKLGKPLMRYEHEKESERSPPKGGHDTTADGG